MILLYISKKNIFNLCFILYIQYFIYIYIMNYEVKILNRNFNKNLKCKLLVF